MSDRMSALPTTMLITLWAKATESAMERPLLRDPKAVEIMKSVDFDFSVFEGCWKSQVGVAVRSAILDRETKRFLKEHRDGAVVNLGAGLDSRMERLGVKDVMWYDLDLPEGIEMRKNFFGETENRRFIAKSIFDFSWMDEIETKGGPVLFIAEGLLMYFPENQVRRLFVELAKRFPGGEMLFESTAPFVVGKARFHDSLSKVEETPEFLWGPKDPEVVSSWSTGIIFVDKWNFFDYAKYRWGWMRFARHLPVLGKSISCHIVKVRFVPQKRLKNVR